MKDVREIIRLWKAHASEPCALATLVRVRGSSYRRPGARMLVTATGGTAGSLSAGCIEEEVAVHAREVLRNGAPKLIVFDTRRRFGCNGSIEIFIERAPEELLLALDHHVESRTACTVETVFEANERGRGSRLLAESDSPVEGALIQCFEPAIRLLVIGSGPDSTALTRQGELLGWDVVVVASINESRMESDQRTAAVVTTHNYGRDCAALRHLLPLGLRYLGAIGPRRRRDELLNDVLDSGANLRSALFAPAGLHLGAESPEEIALSIAAEIQAVFCEGAIVSLRDRRAPIHEPSLLRRELISAV